MLRAGAARASLMAFEPGVGLMGWAHPGNVAEAIETPLWARAFVIEAAEPGGRRVVLACAEICFITLAVRLAVVERLAAHGFAEDDVLLCATHTHSAPAGYSHSFFYDTSAPGFVPAVFEAIVGGLVTAILAAAQAVRPATLRVSSGEFASDVPVAFNRSLVAFNANRDLDRRYTAAERHLAVDRRMTLLRFDDADGVPIGLFNWFGVHATSVHNENRRICSDNKGYAAAMVESQMGEGFVAAFAQGPAGDVTPNFMHHPGLKYPRGPFPDDFMSSRFHGRLQADLAIALFEAAAGSRPLDGPLAVAFGYQNMAEVAVDPEFVGGREDCRTSPAAIGAPMLAGTDEGDGLTGAAAALACQLAWLACAAERARAPFAPPAERERIEAKYRAHDNKAIFFEPGTGKLLNGMEALIPLLPAWTDPLVAFLQTMQARGVLADLPWTPAVLPLQLLRIGSLAIVALPCEPTTTAGRRLRQSLEALLADSGVGQVVVTGYANAYSGYITTPEEYSVQRYEGASTHFGRWTLAAYQTKFGALARHLAGEGPAVASEPRPALLSGEALGRRIVRMGAP